MTKYIDRDALAYFANNQVGGITANHIMRFPTADVEPVKHGRWIKHCIDDPKSILYMAVKDTTCSVCGKSTPYNTKYCMHCGAKMDKEE